MKPKGLASAYGIPVLTILFLSQPPSESPAYKQKNMNALYGGIGGGIAGLLLIGERVTLFLIEYDTSGCSS